MGQLTEGGIALRRRPLQGLTVDGWQNLAAAGLLLFYLIYTGLQVGLGTLCGQMGVDYCDYWSAGRAASLYGYARVYDLQVIGAIEKSILPATADPSQIAVVPFPYLPIFVLPFQPLSLISPAIGFWIWTAINFAVFVLYLRHFARRIGEPAAASGLTLLLVASLPFYLNLFSGQVAVWLTICVGECMISLLRRRPFTAGLWLGGLLLKPQVLLLIGLVLVLQRSVRVLAGLGITSVIVLAGSLLLSGPAALTQMFRLWLLYGSGEASIWPEAMMNWRMLGFHLSTVLPPWIAWGIAALGMVATVGIALYAWRRPFIPGSPSLVTGLLGVLAASAIVAWHSHIHTAMILMPPLIYLFQARALPRKALGYWALVPGLFFVLITFAPAVLAGFHIFSDFLGKFIYFFIGASELAVTLCLFGWAVKASRPSASLGRLGDGTSPA